MSDTATPARWGEPLAKLDALLTKIDVRLCVAVVLLEIATLVWWVSLRALATRYDAGGPNVIGFVFRAITAAAIFGVAAHLLLKKRMSGGTLVGVVLGATFVGGVLGRVFVNVGVDWYANWVDWVQSASTLALIGGPRGVVTRLTLLLALVGASLAAARGKHISIDIAMRYMSNAVAKPVILIGYAAAALVCFLAAYGFTDSIAVTKFRAEVSNTTFSQRLDPVVTGVGDDFFLLRKQIALDLRLLPSLFAGRPHGSVMSGADWNAWVKESGWKERYPETWERLLGPEEGTKQAAVVMPETGEGRDLLIRDLNFVLPFGLLLIGLRFLLRSLLILSRHVTVDAHAAHGEGELQQQRGGEA